MNTIINSVSKLIFGIGIFDILEQIKWSEQQVQKAENLANKKHLQAALDITTDVLKHWSKSPSFLEKKLRHDLQQKQKNWQLKINEFNQMQAQAEQIINKDVKNPFTTNLLSEALIIYQKSQQLNYSEIVVAKISDITLEIDKRNYFQLLVKQGEESGKELFLKESLAKFTEAQNLFNHPKLAQSIKTCVAKIKYEEEYEQFLIHANKLAQAGNFQKAMEVIKPVFTKFPRYDGKEFIAKLQQIINSKICFHAGLLAEKNSDLETAKTKYQEAIMLLPQLEQCWIRLNIVEIKNQNYIQVLSNLTNINNPTAAYLRGYIYAQQGNFTQADQEWRIYADDFMQKQRELLLNLSQRQKLVFMQSIENLVNRGELEEARKFSLGFLQQYGYENLVMNNLNNHIEPAILNRKWQTNDWDKLTRECEKQWREKQDIISLHNWAIATYYHSQIDISKLRELIISWSIAVTNIHHNPIWQNIIWLDHHHINFPEIINKIQRLLENRIENIKENNLQEYLYLRDLYRRETTYWNLIKLGEHPTKSSSLIINNLLISPAGSYYVNHNYFQNHLQLINYENYDNQLCKTLYTDWGLAIAACIQGDIERAINIKPPKSPHLEIEKYAHSWLCYHEGCYYLQNDDNWYKAAPVLKQAKNLILVNSEWNKQLDYIFDQKRRQINNTTNNLSEHLTLSQLWFDLLNSQKAKGYLAEIKAEEVREQIIAEKISLKEALRKLQEIKKIDANNPVTIDLIDKTEYLIEKDEILSMLQNNNFDSAVQFAKKSRHPEILHFLTEICLEILINGIKSNSLSIYDIIRLCNWAYQLSPNDPTVREIRYRLEIF